MPGLLRRLFVRILIHCQPIHPEELWDQFKMKFSEDYARRLSMQQAQRKSYFKIARTLINKGSNLSQFPGMEQIEILNEDDELDTLPTQFTKIGMQQYGQLNDTQKMFVDAVLCAIDNDDVEITCFYIDGPGGSGKTFIYTTFSNLVRGRGKCVSAMAFTGIAAILLPEGKTVHNTFGLPVTLYEDFTSSIKAQSQQGNYLKNVDFFMWDEAPMAPRYALEVADRTLQDIMNNNLPFGGKIIVLGGDFSQLLPVEIGGTMATLFQIRMNGKHENFSQQSGVC
nr:uncharacterized protein LOC124214349 [Neodiprion pinetum]